MFLLNIMEGDKHFVPAYGKRNMGNNYLEGNYRNERMDYYVRLLFDVQSELPGGYRCL